MSQPVLLIVDDDGRNVFALSAVLRTRRYKVVTAQSAAEALHVLRNREDIALVLMDMMMPDMDGYEAIAVIRGYEQWNNLPIVAVTAQAMLGDREKCLAAGADDYISKPVDIDQLERLLMRMLKGLPDKQS